MATQKRCQARLITAITAGKGRVGIRIELGFPDQKPGTQRYRIALKPGHASRVVKRKVCRGIIRDGLGASSGNAHARRRKLVEIETAGPGSSVTASNQDQAQE